MKRVQAIADGHAMFRFAIGRELGLEGFKLFAEQVIPGIHHAMIGGIALGAEFVVGRL